MGYKKKSGMSFDKLITGIIVTGAAASIFGLSRSQKGKSFLVKSKRLFGGITGKSVQIFGKMSIAVLDIFQKK